MSGEHLQLLNDPPTVEIVRAAFVMNVRRPEWLEQPLNPTARYQGANRFKIAAARCLLSSLGGDDVRLKRSGGNCIAI